MSASIEIAPEIREYARTSTTVTNAYIKPLAERYLSTLAAEIAKRGIPAPLLMMLSNGGLAGVAEAKSLGLRVVPWTVNEPDEMVRLVRLGVDGLISDWPDRARAARLPLGFAID